MGIFGSGPKKLGKWLRKVGRKIDPTAPAKRKNNTFEATDVTKDTQNAEYQKQFADALRQQMGNAEQARGQSQRLISALQAQAAGQGPSLAMNQYGQASDLAMKQAAGAVASQRGINPALAARTAAYTRGNMMQEAARGSAMLRAQEQLSAQQQLAGAIQAQRGQDSALAQLSAAGLQGQTAQQLQAQMQAQNINAGVAAQNTASYNQGHANAKQNTNDMVTGGLNAAGAAMGLAKGGKLKVDDPRRDVVPAMLSPGEIVLPRSVALSEDAPERAAEFVEAIQEREAAKSGSYGKVLAIRNGMAKGGKVTPLRELEWRDSYAFGPIERGEFRERSAGKRPSRTWIEGHSHPEAIRRIADPRIKYHEDRIKEHPTHKEAASREKKTRDADIEESEKILRRYGLHGPGYAKGGRAFALSLGKRYRTPIYKDEEE